MTRARDDPVIMKAKASETKNKNMKIVILGGTGLIGSKVVNLLRARGHEVVAASPSQGINSITGEGLTEALTGAQVVVDVTNSPSFDDEATSAPRLKSVAWSLARMRCLVPAISQTGLAAPLHSAEPFITTQTPK